MMTDEVDVLRPAAGVCVPAPHCLPLVQRERRRPLPPGAIGCFLSHYAIHKKARQAGLRSFLVLEDDAVFRPSAGKRFRQAIAQLPDGWDALYLGYNRYFSPASDCHARAAEDVGRCRCGDVSLCRAKAHLLHTHAIALLEAACAVTGVD